MKAPMRVKLNIRGTSYETYESTLRRYPNTLLGNDNERKHFYDYKRNEYYFDCKAELFDSILFFYQTGILAKPCFSPHSEYQEILQFFGIVKKKMPPPAPTNRRARLWQFLEHPQMATNSLVFAYLSFFIIIASVATLCAETEIDGLQSANYRFGNHWFIIECCYITFFTFEYLLRMYAAPSRLQFAKSLLGIIDACAILPFYLGFIIMTFSKNFTMRSAGIIRILRLIQIFRIVKLSRYSTGMQILGKSLFCCKDQVFSLCAFFLIGITFSSSVVFIVEDISGTGVFEDIPSTMWFSVISMTTVGYGDYYPRSVAGKIATVASIFLGTVILFYLFLPIYLMYFTIFYTNAQRESNEEKDRKKAERENQKQKSQLLEKEKLEEELINKEAQNLHKASEGLVVVEKVERSKSVSIAVEASPSRVSTTSI